MKYPKSTTVKCQCGRGVLDFVPQVDLNPSGSRVLGKLYGCFDCEMEQVQTRAHPLSRFPVIDQ